jgi:hypothetical protein
MKPIANVPDDDPTGDPLALERRRWKPPVDGGRLGVYAALGATVSAVPLPWLPDALVRRVRGALVHDVAMRHRLGLTRDAREVLAEPSGPDGPRGLLSQALRFVGVKVALRAITGLGPIGMVWPVRNALGTYVLGHLFDRYLEISRTERTSRIDVDEARRVRRAIDSALVRAVTVATGPVRAADAVADDREASTVMIDSLLGATAGIPERLVRRLDAAFDDLLLHADG